MLDLHNFSNLTMSHQDESCGFAWDFSRLLVERARWIRCVITRSIASAGVSCRKGNTAGNNSRTLAVDSAGKISTSNWRAKLGSRAYACAQTNLAWATNHNAAAVSAK